MSKYVQFSNSKRTNQLIDGIVNGLTINPDEFWETFFNIDTAQRCGLDNWGKIFGLPRIVLISDSTDDIFGFGVDEDYPLPYENAYPQNFDNGSFFDPDIDSDSTVPYELNDYQYRQILKFRYRCLTSNFSMISINQILNELLINLNPQYKCYAIQTAQFRIEYRFNFQLDDWIRAMFNNRKILPVPAGVNGVIMENQRL